MSAKKTENNPGKGKRIALWAVMVGLILVLAVLLLLLWGLHLIDEPHSPVQPDGTSVAATDSAQAGAQQTIASAVEDIQLTLEHGIEVINIGAYTGMYMEDGTDEVVSGVLMLVVKNTGAEAIEYAQFALPTPAGEAQFSVSTLLPGASVVLLEKNRMAYTGEENWEQLTVDAVAIFKEPLSLQEDQLELQILDGAINVTNISGRNITGDILIYYKNSAADLYYGGITYRARIEGGMKAGEIRQIMASHFSDTGSKIMFVTIY